MKKPLYETGQWDVAIVGAGPAGVAAALGLRPEGLRVIILDAKYPGGQISGSSLVENVFGAGADGRTGLAMMAGGLDQALKFGTVLKTPFHAVRLIPPEGELGCYTIVDANRERITADAVVLALGAAPRRLDAENLDGFLGRGVAYGSPQYEVASQWTGKRVGLVGAGNGAGQAASFLAQCDNCHVIVFSRGDGLESSMSYYLLERIKQAGSRVTVYPKTTIKRINGGDGSIKSVLIDKGGALEEVELDFLFIQIGGVPPTGWLDSCKIAVNEKGYLLTDRDLPEDVWANADRPPFLFETSLRGVFAGGDVRFGSPSRMSVALGEGAALAPSVYNFLSNLAKKRQEAEKKRPQLVAASGKPAA